VLVNYLVAVKLHLLLALSTPELCRLLGLLADMLNIPQELQILRAV
jgi:hypothetical protein